MEQGREELSELSAESEGLEPSVGGESDVDTSADDSYESARETVEREYEKLLKDSEAEEPGQESAEPEAKQRPEKPVRAAKKGAEQPQPQQEGQPFNIPAPARLSLEQKELFNQIPDKLKRGVHEMFRAHEAQFTQGMQKLNAREREASGVLEAVHPYLYKHPELQEAGFTPSRLVGALIAAHQRLTDPAQSRPAIAELAEQAGLDPSIVQAIRGSQQQIPQQQQIPTLPPEAKEAIDYVNKLRQQQMGQLQQNIAAELTAVQNEIGPDGRYARPYLHDVAFLEKWKPLVSALAGTMSYANAGKEAYRILTGGQQDNSSQINQARLPANNQMQRAQQAAVSVRGRSAPASTATGALDDIPTEDLGDARQTVKLALENMRRGV